MASPGNAGPQKSHILAITNQTFDRVIGDAKAFGIFGVDEVAPQGQRIDLLPDEEKVALSDARVVLLHEVVETERAEQKGNPWTPIK